MFEVISVTILVALIAFYDSYAKMKHPLWVPALILAIFFSLRYNYTMDYAAYGRIFSHLNAYANVNYYYDIRDIEIGWKILNRLLGPLGYQSVVIVTTFFQIGVFVWFAEKYVDRKWQWILFVIYMIQPWYLLMQLSSMRQTVSMSIMILGLPYIFKKKLFKSFLIWLIALAFHNSTWIALPILFVGYLKPRYWKTISITIFSIILIAAFVPMIFFDLARSSIGLIGIDRYEFYMIRGGAAQLASGFGLLYRVIFISYLVYSMKGTDKHMFIFLFLYCLSFPFQLMGMTGMYFGRLGWFYSYLGMPGLMIYVYNWRKSLVDRALFTVYILVEIYTYLNFFTAYFPEGFLHYETVLEF